MKARGQGVIPSGNLLQISCVGYHVNGSLLTVELQFRRQYDGFVVTTFIPIVLLIIIALLTFFFERDDFTNRVMVTLSAFIVLASLFSQTSSELPHTSYIKCIDVVFLCPIFLISLVFACHVLLSLMHQHATNAVIKVSPGVLKSRQHPYRRYCRLPLSPGNQVALGVCCCAVLCCLPLVALQCHF